MSKDEVLNCSDIWHVYLTAKFGVNQFGKAKFYPSKVIKDNPMWTNVFYHAVKATAYYDNNHVCGFDDGLIVTVKDSCDKLTTDTKYLISFEIALIEMQANIRLYSGCKQFPVDVGKLHPFLLGFDGRMLCRPLMANGHFPCISEQRILCESILHCALHLEVQLIQSSHTDCRSAGYYVDITGAERSVNVRLRWLVNSHRKVTFTADMYSGDFEYFYQRVMFMDITSNGASSTFCQLEITQTIVQGRQLVISHSTVLSDISPSCLVRRTYYDDLAHKRRSHCFKWDMSPEYIAVNDEKYIRVNSSDLSWVQAEEFCQRYNDHLVSIASVDEEQTVRYLFDGGPSFTPSAFYIGLNLTRQVNL